MVLNQDLLNKGFRIANVSESDYERYYYIIRVCYEKYIDEYYGGWVEETQLKMNTDTFNRRMNQSTFKKLLLNDEVVGFIAFDVLPDKIDGISVQLLDQAQNMGIGSCCLNHIVTLSKKHIIPACLVVFKSNPSQNLCNKFGFIPYDETDSKYLLKYDPIV